MQISSIQNPRAASRSGLLWGIGGSVVRFSVTAQDVASLDQRNLTAMVAFAQEFADNLALLGNANCLVSGSLLTLYRPQYIDRVLTSVY